MKHLPIIKRLCLAAALIGTALLLRELTLHLRLFSVADKFKHALAYGCLAWALLYFLRPITSRRLLWILGIVMVIGAGDEVRQNWTDGHPDILDWLANLAGASIAGIGWKLSHRAPTVRGDGR